ncbi:MAG: glycosyltransferase [Clostridium sp.]|nr:glycosyltransferase [Clostridium sp.]
MQNKKVSLIIPVYNTENYLERCLESAVSQTYQNMEIICIDDGSTDNSGRIVDEFAKRDGRVLAIHQPNKGESNARNTGLRAAAGDYIGFMDCDDWIEPDMYESLVKALEKDNADMAIAGFYREFEEPGKQRITVQNEKTVEPKSFDGQMLLRYLYERDAYRTFAYIWDKLYKREVVYNGIDGPIVFDESMKLGGDVLYLAQCALNTGRAVYVDKTFYHYLQRDVSGCHLPDLARKQDNIRAYRMVQQKFMEHGVEPLVMDFIKRILVYHSSYMAELAYELKDKSVLEEAQALMREYEKEYRRLNADKTEWLTRFDEILQYQL